MTLTVEPFADLRTLLQVERKRDSGSPRVTGSKLSVAATRRPSARRESSTAAFPHCHGEGGLGLAVALLALPAFSGVQVVVSRDSKGDFKTIQQAVDHAPLSGDDRLIIQIRPGIYHERVMVP